MADSFDFNCEQEEVLPDEVEELDISQDAQDIDRSHLEQKPDQEDFYEKNEDGSAGEHEFQ